MTAVFDPIPAAPAPSGAAAVVPAPAGVTSDYLGYRLASQFQPIYSLTHHRAIGHEALLRAARIDTGAAVPPLCDKKSLLPKRAPTRQPKQPPLLPRPLPLQPLPSPHPIAALLHRARNSASASLNWTLQCRAVRRWTSCPRCAAS